MFVTLRRYQKWLFGGIIAVIIPSFVVFFSPDAAFSGRHKGNFGSINGRAIAYEEYANAYHETELQFRFSYGTWPSGNEAKQFGFDIDRETQRRIFLIEKMKENQIHPSDEAINKWLAAAFTDRSTREYNPEMVKNFVGQIREKGMREADFLRFAGHEVGIQQLVGLFGLNGKFVTPLEAEQAYRAQNEQVQAEAVIFSSTNYLASVNITTNALQTYYTNRISSYQVPKKVQVRYVFFPVTNFLAEATQSMAKETNLNQMIDAFYRQRGASFYTDTNGAVMAEAQAKEKIKDQYLHESAMKSARIKAGLFAVELSKIVPVKSDNLNNLAASNGMPIAITEPFTENGTPKGLKVLASFNKAAFNLTPEEPLSLPVVGEDGVYIAALEKIIPDTIPPFEAVRAKVTDDYRKYQALMETRKAGELFHQSLTNALAAGKSFKDACAEAKVVPIALPKFSMSARTVDDLDGRLNISSIQRLVSDLPVGKVSRMDYSQDGGYILHLIARLPVEKATLDKELPDFIKNMRQSRQYDAFSDWLNRSAIQARLSGPPTADKTSENSEN
jgi:hypothetical protein